MCPLRSPPGQRAATTELSSGRLASVAGGAVARVGGRGGVGGGVGGLPAMGVSSGSVSRGYDVRSDGATPTGGQGGTGM